MDSYECFFTLSSFPFVLITRSFVDRLRVSSQHVVRCVLSSSTWHVSLFVLYGFSHNTSRMRKCIQVERRGGRDSEAKNNYNDVIVMKYNAVDVVLRAIVTN